MNDASIARTLTSALLESDRTPDCELLRRFATTRDEVAFELLVRRHADLVWTISRSILRDDLHSAEDAFQVTFIALARHATALQKCGSLNAWLFRVTRHAALRVRKKQRSRACEPLPASASSLVDQPEGSAEVSERASLVAEEVDRLPDRLRTPVILCFYRGLTHVEAALQLGWAVGTVASRIARAKDRLRGRLSKRGVVLASAMTAVAGISGPVSAGTPLMRLCVQAALDGSIIPSRLLTLFHEVIPAMRPVQRTWLFLAPIAAAVFAMGGVMALDEASQNSAPKESNTGRTDDVHPVKGFTKPTRAEQPVNAGAKERALSQMNLARIAEAIKAYQVLNGHLPTDFVSKDGKPLLSWRVAILPYIEQRNLYKLFKLDEPWDSQANKFAGSILVKLYMAGLDTPNNADGYGLTYVKRFTGPSTLHIPGEKVDLSKSPENARKTLLVAEVGDPIPWTKPDDPVITPAAKDKPFVPKTPPVWRGPYKNVINAAFADGTALSLKPDLSSETLAALIYWNSGLAVPDRNEVQASIPADEQNEDIKELLKSLREMTDQIVKLSEEEAKLQAELDRLQKLPSDPATQLARKVIEIDAQLRTIRGQVRSLKEGIEKAKKGPGK
jgi:RNA polymerase sigma factor (sigma-70 family)